MNEKQLEALAQKLATTEHKSLWQVFNPKHMKLHLLKQAINYTTGLTKDLVPVKKPSFLITKTLDKTFTEALEMMKHGTANWHEDQNFPRLIETARRILTFIAEEDGYYRAWLEMFCMMLANNTKEMVSKQ